MVHLSDYIRWMGDFPISKTGFLEADAIVLCVLSYIDFTPAFRSEDNILHEDDSEQNISEPDTPALESPEQETPIQDSSEAETPVQVSTAQNILVQGKRVLGKLKRDNPFLYECLTLLQKKLLRVMFVGGSMGSAAYLEILEAAASSKRFGSLKMSNYRNTFHSEPPVQFSAICFSDDENFSFLAYRGTDSTLSGWEEDFMISFTRTEAQKMALEYAEKHIRPERDWYIGGHSKGGNLALYASCLMSDEKWNAVKHVYIMDSPGFSPDVFDLTLFDRVDSKTTHLLPAFSIVGKLFAPRITDIRIVRSFISSVLQHNLVTWGIEYGKPVYLEKFDKVSLAINEIINEWISGLKQEDRAEFVQELFNILASGGAETLEDVFEGGLESLECILRGFSEASPTTKQILIKFRKSSEKVGLDGLKKLFVGNRAAMELEVKA